MKASRDQLKALMKEIFLEILSEGLGNTPAPRTNSISRASGPSGSVTEQRMINGRRKPSFDPRLDAPIGNRTPSNALREAVRQESGGNPILADILADTAMTTLPTQLGAGDSMGQPSVGSPGLSRNQQEHIGDPSEIFEGGQTRGDGSSHWADLAFSGGKKSA